MESRASAPYLLSPVGCASDGDHAYTISGSNGFLPLESMASCRCPIAPWQRKQMFGIVVGSFAFAWTFSSLAICEKKTGSRPERPMSDARHSPYGDTLYAGVGLPLAG